MKNLIAKDCLLYLLYDSCATSYWSLTMLLPKRFCDSHVSKVCLYMYTWLTIKRICSLEWQLVVACNYFSASQLPGNTVGLQS